MSPAPLFRKAVDQVMIACLVAFAVPVAAPFFAPVSAEPLVLAPDQMRVLGLKALAAGDATLALQIAESLLGRDGSDDFALVLKARALRALGRLPEAQRAARAAWAGAKTSDERYAAAMTMAQVLASSNRRTAAQFWLRRAAQAAPTDRAEAVAKRDFRYVRSRNPLVLRFDASIAPSSNINNGSSSSTMELLGLPFTISGDARALSGVEAAFGMTARYRLPPTETRTTEFRASLMGRHYWLSDEAQAQAPEARGQDYDFAGLEFGVARRMRAKGAKTAYDYGLTLGHNWYGGADLSSYLRLDLGAERRFSDVLTGVIGVSAERQIREDGSDRSAEVIGVNAAVIRTRANSDRFRFSIGLRDTDAAAISIDHRAIFAGIDYDKGSPVAGVRLGMGLSLEARDYAQTPYSVGGRQDFRMSAGLSMTFETIDYMGFSPSLNLRASKTRSNIGLYDARDLGVSFGIRSAF